eukprot:1148692-Pelagomonas_calceolata.AAC.6
MPLGCLYQRFRVGSGPKCQGASPRCRHLSVVCRHLSVGSLPKCQGASARWRLHCQRGGVAEMKLLVGTAVHCTAAIWHRHTGSGPEHAGAVQAGARRHAPSTLLFGKPHP